VRVERNLRRLGDGPIVLAVAQKKPNRSTDAVVYVYCSAEQKAQLEKAAAKVVEGIPGAQLPTYQFVLQAALEKAAKVLGAK
jgi:uncharacterized protein (DUF1778 family)